VNAVLLQSHEATYLLELLKNDAAVLVSPVPSVFQELIASQVGLLNAFLGETVHNLGLGSNRSVVGTRNPQRVLALHAGTAYQDILNSLIEHVTHVQHTSHIRRRDYYSVRFTLIGNRFEQIRGQASIYTIYPRPL
jgi:hypothetical protein